MMLVKRVLLAGALVAMAAGACGCRPQIVGTDAGVYSAGTLYAVDSKDMTAVYEATVQALGDLELTVTESAKDVFSAKVLAKGADGKLVAVIIRPGKENLTDLSIKVGPVGNRHRSEVIYEQIRKRLSGAVK